MSDFHVGPPRVIDFSCHVREPDSGSASCELHIKVEDNEAKSSEKGEPSSKTIAMELQPAALNTLLDGLGRIRDQLSTVASRKM